MKKDYILVIIFSILCLYLLINTGIISDEFDVIFKVKNKNIEDLLILNRDSYFLETPVEHYTHFIWYRFFRIDNLALINIFKITYIVISFYMVSRFFKIFLDTYTALWVSFLFIFFPSHDSTVHCFMGQYLTLSFAFYLYSFYLAHRNKLIWAFISALMASFISYGSAPVAVALFILFTLRKEFKKGACLLIPNIIYALFFIPFNIIMRQGVPRIIEKFSIGAMLKQFILQVLTFIDSFFGPSMWLKIYYAFAQLSLISFFIGVAGILIFYKIRQEPQRRYDYKLIISFAVLLFLSFLMFAATGRYPQLAFNLGNRTTIFGSLLVAYLLVLLPLPSKIRTLIFALMIFTILGISDHWKKWNLHQQYVIIAIKNNYSLQNYADIKPIYVSGNQYSKYGPISHIEFFSEDWVPNSVFKLALNENISAKSFNKRHKYADGYLIDAKYNKKTVVRDYIMVYDSEKNILFKLNSQDINSYIDSLPVDNRHWVQLFNIEFIKNIVNTLMPRLKYIL